MGFKNGLQFFSQFVAKLEPNDGELMVKACRVYKISLRLFFSPKFQILLVCSAEKKTDVFLMIQNVFSHSILQRSKDNSSDDVSGLD